MSRIPELMDGSDSSMFLWWRQMAAAGLAFHPDDPPADVIGIDEKFLFSRDEARQLTAIIEELHSTHGDLIYIAALQATEEPDVTAARQEAIDLWATDEIQVSPYAEVEKVEGGYWVVARCWVPAE